MSILGIAFLCAAEYAFVGVRRTRIDAMARRGSASARRVQDSLKNIGVYIAAFDIGITMFSLLVGRYLEPLVTRALTSWLGQAVDGSVGFIIAFTLITFVTVVVGEVVPKYIGIHSPERVALFTVLPLQLFTKAIYFLIYLVQTSSTLILRPFGIRIESHTSALPKEELLLVVKAGGSEGTLNKLHADIVGRALRLDSLAARDIMVHRLDIGWLDVGVSRKAILAELARIPHSRIPVCRGDIDDMVGIVYLHDVVKALDGPGFELEKLVKPAVAVPENLTLDRLVTTMRDAKSQIVIVLDEYGGTSGLITLEDIVEEVFGELEDRLESERPPIEVHGSRVSARADVRFDELVHSLNVEISEDPRTDTLATMMVERLERMPKLGDQVETELGVMRVENMARRRITRVTLTLLPDLATARQVAEEDSK